MSISGRTIRNVGTAAAAAAMIVALAVTASVNRAHVARAFADDVKAEMARTYRDASTWRAHIEERELVADGAYRTTRHRVVVGGPNRYRIETIEQDASGREVISVTLRNGNTVYAAMPADDGGTRVLELRNVPPSLGALADNMLGQRVRDLARAGQMRYAGREKVRGKAALKLQVEPDHAVWVDATNSAPLREQYHADGMLTHEIEFLLFDPESAVDQSEFDPTSLGAQPSVTEDLGFRSADLRSAPALLGFTPREFSAPDEWRLLESGYIEPTAAFDEVPGTHTWISHYSTPVGPVLITQSAVDEEFVLSPEAGDGTEGPLLTEVGGHRVAYYTDPWRTHATMHVGDTLVAVEGVLPPETVLDALTWVR
ncbi:MAG: hypothetical protein ACNA76_01450 [Anaerosomatales bacterium]